MFNRSQRMNSREFTITYKKGKKYFSEFFRLVAQNGSSKIAVVIPKKKLKKRVQRNREKRRILSVLRSIFTTTQLDKNIIIFLQKDTSQLSFDQLSKELQKTIKKTDI